MNPILICHGTWGRYKDWHVQGSPIWKALENHGFEPIDFRWSGYLGGFPGPIIVPEDAPEMAGNLMLWASEGEKLTYFCRLLSTWPEPPDALTHSHGLQVLVMAAAAGQQFRNVLSISGPVREDMKPWREKARPNIKNWIQVVDHTDDMIIREGEIFGKMRLGWAFDLPEADHNIEADGYGHSGLILDPTDWEKLGIWKALAS